MIDTERTLRYLPLDRLVPPMEKVRKTPTEGAAFEQLKASIAAHGLLENLLVRPIEKDDSGAGRHEVVSGGRRLEVLQALSGEGAIAQDHPVACHVLPVDSAVAELCLAENTVRAAMHPADQFEAFARQVDAGATVPGIAARFSVSRRTVEQWLRLGNAHPDILDAYRAGEIGLKSLKAFCVTSDTQRQHAVWDELKARQNSPSMQQICCLVMEGWISASAPVARFVGLAAYEAAGGGLIHDIFAEGDYDGIWFDDSGLLRKLALERLEAAAGELRTKWSWAEVRVYVNKSYIARFAQVDPIPGDLTEDEVKEFDRLIVRVDELTALDDDDWNEDAESELERVETRLEELRRFEFVDRAVFRRKDMEMAGAIVTLNDDGTLRVIEGLVRPEDPAATGAHPAAADPASADHDGVERK